MRTLLNGTPDIVRNGEGPRLVKEKCGPDEILGEGRGGDEESRLKEWRKYKEHTLLHRTSERWIDGRKGKCKSLLRRVSKTSESTSEDPSSRQQWEKGAAGPGGRRSATIPRGLLVEENQGKKKKSEGKRVPTRSGAALANRTFEGETSSPSAEKNWWRE